MLSKIKHYFMGGGKLIAVLCILCLMYLIAICYFTDFTFYDPDPMNRIRNLALAAPGGILFYLTALKISRWKRSRQNRRK